MPTAPIPQPSSTLISGRLDVWANAGAAHPIKKAAAMDIALDKGLMRTSPPAHRRTEMLVIQQAR
jgi:hypothetical protein